MSIIARQIPPEYQSSPWEYFGWAGTMWADLNICGNRHFNDYMSDLFSRVWDRFESNRVCRAMELLTGEKWDRTTIRGYCQGDWQDVYFPTAKYSADDLRILEIEYFNLGTEWEIIYTEAPDDAYCAYCYTDTDDRIRAEIASIAGSAPDDVTLQKFTGWSRSATYTKV